MTQIDLETKGKECTGQKNWNLLQPPKYKFTSTKISYFQNYGELMGVNIIPNAKSPFFSRSDSGMALSGMIVSPILAAAAFLEAAGRITLFVLMLLPAIGANICCKNSNKTLKLINKFTFEYCCDGAFISAKAGFCFAFNTLSFGTQSTNLFTSSGNYPDGMDPVISKEYNEFLKYFNIPNPEGYKVNNSIKGSSKFKDLINEDKYKKKTT